MTYILLARDLDAAMKAYEPVTAAEIKVWESACRNGGIQQEMLGMDHPQALRLLEEDGWDGETVGSCPASSAKRFWSYGEDHLFPPFTDLVRFALFMHMGFWRAFALLVKRMWEEHIRLSALGSPWSEALFDPDTVVRNKGLFRVDAGAAYACLEAQKHLASRSGHTVDAVEKAAREMVLCDLHLAANDSPELAAFVERMKREGEMARQEDEATCGRFWLTKCKWLELQEELGAQLLEVENCRLENENIYHNWMALFGDAYIRMQEEEKRKNDLERRILLKKIDPDLDESRMEEKVREEEKKAQERIEEMRMIMSVPNKMLVHDFGNMSEDFMVQRKSECKQILRKIWRLIHPDLLENNPAYRKLTQEQKQYLDELRNRLTQIRNSEIGYHASQIGWNNRSPEYLREALATAEKILAHAGLDTDVRLIIEGETMGEQLAWLDKDIDRLARGIEDAKAERFELLNDSLIKDMRRLLGCPEQHEKTRAHFLRQAEDFRREADRLAGEFASLMKKDRP